MTYNPLAARSGRYGLVKESSLHRIKTAVLRHLKAGPPQNVLAHQKENCAKKFLFFCFCFFDLPTLGKLLFFFFTDENKSVSWYTSCLGKWISSQTSSAEDIEITKKTTILACCTYSAVHTVGQSQTSPLQDQKQKFLIFLTAASSCTD